MIDELGAQPTAPGLPGGQFGGTWIPEYVKSTDDPAKKAVWIPIPNSKPLQGTATPSSGATTTRVAATELPAPSICTATCSPPPDAVPSTGLRTVPRRTPTVMRGTR